MSTARVCPKCGSSDHSRLGDTAVSAIGGVLSQDLVVGLATGNIGQVLAGSGGVIGLFKFATTGLETRLRHRCNGCKTVNLRCPGCETVLVPNAKVGIGSKIQCNTCDKVFMCE